MTQKAKIHVIGSYAVGMTMRTGIFPNAGETVQGYGFQQFHGGKGSNQAVGAARMGADVLYTGCLGKDLFGDLAVAMLKDEGIRAETVVRTSECSTGVGLVMVSESGENEIVIDLAANDKLSAEHIDRSFDCDFDADILLVQLEANLDAVYYALKKAKEKGIPSIINPAPFREVPEDFIKLATFITPNQTEAAQLTGTQGDPESQCRYLKSKYGVDIILTVGKDGAYYTQDDKVLHSRGYSVKAVDTTGAGDCFNASLAVMLAEKKPLAEALDIANFAAASSVKSNGVLESLPYRNILEDKLNKHGE